MHGGPSKDPGFDPTTGIADKPADITAGPISEDSLFGDSDRLSDFSGFTVSQENRVLPESSKELSNLQKSKEEQNNWTENFVHVLNCWCVKGSYHQDMLHMWDIFHEEKGSENDRPDIFPDTQLHIVLEFSHGGRDLEGFVFNNAGQAHAIFLQIAYTLAVAEQQLEFEHRDLHWGNVLIATTTKNYVEFKLNEGTYCLDTKGVVATVIDFTLSRLKTPHCVMYNNLAEDPSLFTAEGDYQFEIYRQMKKVNR
ncbi:serine/threonine-protein kinase haspin-like [Macrobrachium nipponense]|uniref:serine/threonine-protein kinase haspin-like n=1 Tax=Macrobrachium nipponense TaxID=159736 RepID=UPI0030C7ACF5